MLTILGIIPQKDKGTSSLSGIVIGAIGAMLFWNQIIK